MRHTIWSRTHCRSLEHRYLEKSGSIPFRRNLVVFVLACAILGLNSFKRHSASHRESAAPAIQVVTEKRKSPTLPPCPEAPYTRIKAEDPTTGHHKVFLTWNASTSASESDPNPFGYCLYRTQTAGKAKDCPKKYPCEQVNVVPVSGTRCVDELVRDDSTYYYVAIAITSTHTSTTSEEAIAEVPLAGKQNTPPPDADSYPACRIPAIPQQPLGR